MRPIRWEDAEVREVLEDEMYLPEMMNVSTQDVNLILENIIIAEEVDIVRASSRSNKARVKRGLFS